MMTSSIQASPRLECSLPLREEILFQPLGKEDRVFPDIKIDSLILGPRVEIDFTGDLSLTCTAVTLTQEKDLDGWEIARLNTLRRTDARFLLSIRSDFTTCDTTKWDAFRTLFRWIDENHHEEINDSLAQNLVDDIWFAGRVMLLDDFRKFLNQEWSLPILVYMREWDGEFYLNEIHEGDWTIPFATLQSCAYGESAGFLLWWESQEMDNKSLPDESILKCAGRLLDNSPDTLVAEISNGELSCFVQRLPEITEELSTFWNTAVLASVPSSRCALQFDFDDNFWELKNQENLIWDNINGFHSWISPQLRERDFLVYGLSFYQEETGESWSDGQDLERSSDYELLFQQIESILKENGRILGAPLTSVDPGFAKAVDENENEHDISNIEIRRLIEEATWQKIKSFIADDTDKGFTDLGYFIANHPSPPGIFAARGYLRVGYEQLLKILRHPDLHFAAFIDISCEVRNIELQNLLKSEIEDLSPSLFLQLAKQFGARFCAALHDGWADGLTIAGDEDFMRYLQYRLLLVAAEVTEQKHLTGPDSEMLHSLVQVLKSCNTGEDQYLIFEPKPLSGTEGWQIAHLDDFCITVQLVIDESEQYRWGIV